VPYHSRREGRKSITRRRGTPVTKEGKGKRKKILMIPSKEKCTEPYEGEKKKNHVTYLFTSTNDATPGSPPKRRKDAWPEASPREGEEDACRGFSNRHSS